MTVSNTHNGDWGEGGNGSVITSLVPRPRTERGPGYEAKLSL